MLLENASRENDNGSGPLGSTAFSQVIITRLLNILNVNIKELQRAWEEKNINFRNKAIGNARSIRQTKNRYLSDLDGPLNYETRYKAIHTRLKDDFSDAKQRLLMAYQGLQEIYAYPTGEQFSQPDGDLFDDLEKNVLWVRSAIRWLLAFGQLDQAWSLVLSVRALVGEANWQKEINQQKKSATFSFLVPQKTFESHKYVRLRGVSVFVSVNGDLSSPWSGSAKVPVDAIVLHEVGNRSINQKDVPRCRFGRIENRTSTRSPEITGLISLMNASPVSNEEARKQGSWIVEIETPANGRSKLTDLNDIELELNLLGRPVLDIEAN